MIDSVNEALIKHAAEAANAKRNKIADIAETLGIIRELELMLIKGDRFFDSETIFIEMISQTQKFNQLSRVEPKKPNAIKTFKELECRITTE